jgi:hypothetical protein
MTAGAMPGNRPNRLNEHDGYALDPIEDLGCIASISRGVPHFCSIANTPAATACMPNASSASS